MVFSPISLRMPLAISTRGLAVERAGRFVQDQELRVVAERAGDRQTLALPAGEQAAAHADHIVDAGRQRLDEVPGIGGFQSARSRCRG